MSPPKEMIEQRHQFVLCIDHILFADSVEDPTAYQRYKSEVTRFGVIKMGGDVMEIQRPPVDIEYTRTTEILDAET